MAGEIFIADKITLDEVNKKIDNFSGGTDWSKYTPLCLSARWSPSDNQGKWVEIANIKGDGYFKYLQCSSGDFGGSVSGDLSSKLRLTIDDIIVADLANRSGCKITFLPYELTNTKYFLNNKTDGSFGTTIDVMFFKKSILIERWNGVGGGSGVVEGAFNFVGGVKA